MLSSSEERPVHWSLLGAGVEGCCRESPPNCDYPPPRQLLPETDLWHTKSTTFTPRRESIQVGDSGAWGRGGGAKKHKQTKHRRRVGTTARQRLPRKLTGVIFLCSKKTRAKRKETDHGRVKNRPILLYERSPRGAFVRGEGTSRCATFTASMTNN